MKSFYHNPPPPIHSRLGQLGQGMTEYIVIVALIAVAAIGVVGYFGDTIQHQVAGLAAEVSGNSGTTEKNASGAAARDAAAAASAHKNLGNYDVNSQGGANAD